MNNYLNIGGLLIWWSSACEKAVHQAFHMCSLKFSTVVFCVSISFPNAAADKMGCCWVFLYYFSMPYV